MNVPYECYLSCLLNKHHFKPHVKPLFLCERLSACVWGQLQVQQLEWDQEPWDGSPCWWCSNWSECGCGSGSGVTESWSCTSQGEGDMAWEPGASEVKTKGGWRDQGSPRELSVWEKCSLTELGLWSQGLASPSASIGAYCVRVCSLCVCNLSVQALGTCVNL